MLTRLRRAIPATFTNRMRAVAYRATISALDPPPSLHAIPIETPWMVSIQYDAACHDRVGWHCAAGVLIGNRHVLTCAHPFSQDAQAPGTIPLSDKTFFVRIGGSLDHDAPYKITEVQLHPGFVPATGAHDLAVAILDRDAEATPLPLDPEPARAAGDEVIVLGWPEGRLGPGLTRVRTTIIDPRIGGTPGMLCLANLPTPDDMRAGYSGGPVIRSVKGSQGSPTLCGILSHGATHIRLDGVGAPALAVDLNAEADFIRRALPDQGPEDE